MGLGTFLSHGREQATGVQAAGCLTLPEIKRMFDEMAKAQGESLREYVA